MYYDLANATTCSNPLHGCAFKDSFGQTIHRNQLWSKRKMYLRTLRLMRSNGGTFNLHCQRDFSPVSCGFADYFIAGEQNQALLARNPKGFFTITDLQWVTEYDRDILGPCVVFLPAAASARNADYKKVTEGMLACVLPHDLDVLKSHGDRETILKLFDAFASAGVYEPQGVTVRRASEQKEISCSNPALQFAWYRTGTGRITVIVSNKSSSPVREQVVFKPGTPLSKVKLFADYWRDGSFTRIHRKYSKWNPACGKHAVKVSDGKMTVSLPAESFAILVETAPAD